MKTEKLKQFMVVGRFKEPAPGAKITFDKLYAADIMGSASSLKMATKIFNESLEYKDDLCKGEISIIEVDFLGDIGVFVLAGLLGDRTFRRAPIKFHKTHQQLK